MPIRQSYFYFYLFTYRTKTIKFDLFLRTLLKTKFRLFYSQINSTHFYFITPIFSNTPILTFYFQLFFSFALVISLFKHSFKFDFIFSAHPWNYKINNCAKHMHGKSHKKLNPDEIKERLKNFLINFVDPEMEEELQQPYDRLGKKKYMIMMQKIANERLNTMQIHIEDIEEALRKEEERKIVEQSKTNVKRYIEIFQQVIESIMPKRSMNINPEEDMVRYELQNALKNQREQNMKHMEEGLLAQNQKIPSKMTRKYSVFITYKNRKPTMIRSISEIDSSMIGSLIIVKGIVIRTDEVKPRLSIGTFTCDVCGCENYMQILNDKFTPMQSCQSKKCKQNNVNGKLTFLPKHSYFMPSQQIKIQEVPEQLKQGNIPRNMKLILTNSNIKKAHPGDIIQIQGVVLPKRKQSSMLDQDIIFDSCMQAFKIVNQKKRYVDMNITAQDRQEIEQIRQKYNNHELFQHLATSIAPQIYGLQCVKKALLLLLAGGVTAVTNDNMKIRGQINVMLVGDPGVAKSQLLKYISYMAPRGVYTTGKGSSDVGLTAAIKIDPTTKDVSLEAGALVLADMGVCCIDQFDKMNEYDRTAIHEVMEQQTVSIAKAGLTTTLNARTSVLAAANPLYSRYNPNQTPTKNINLPAALLSRFDLIFILLDTPDKQKDIKLAQHIARVHKNKKMAETSTGFSIRTLKNYIALSKEYEPKLSQNLSKILINKYVQKRIYYSDKSKQGQRYITTRNLLALIRLCQARARLRFSNEITEEDILQCEQIMQESQKNVNTETEVRKQIIDDVTKTFKMIKDMFDYRQDERAVLEYNTVKKRVLAKGLSQDCLQKTIQNYVNLNVLIRYPNGDISLVIE